MSRTILQDTPVLTKDNVLLGQTHAYHRRVEQGKPAVSLYPLYLMIVNLTVGDDFYIPTDFIDDEKSTDDKIWLTLTEKEIEVKQYTRMPVDDHYQHEVLPLRPGSGQEIITTSDDDDDGAKPLSDTAPLPSGLRRDD